MRISDWSSDVCSSDLSQSHGGSFYSLVNRIINRISLANHLIDLGFDQSLSLFLCPVVVCLILIQRLDASINQSIHCCHLPIILHEVSQPSLAASLKCRFHGILIPSSEVFKIGRASCRKRVCQSL